MNPLELFLNTIAVVFGILIPLFLLAVVYSIGQAFQDSKQANIRKLEKERKADPYDELTLQEVPNPTMYNVKMWRNGEVVAEQGVDKI